MILPGGDAVDKWGAVCSADVSGRVAGSCWAQLSSLVVAVTLNFTLVPVWGLGAVTAGYALLVDTFWRATNGVPPRRYSCFAP